MGLAKCSVPGCEVNLLPRHRFPNPNKDLARLEVWRQLIQNPAFENLSPQELYGKKVCHRHFEEKYSSPGANKLHLNAVPSLYLPPYPTESNEQPSTSDEALSSTTKRKATECDEVSGALSPISKRKTTCVELGSSDQALVRCETPELQQPLSGHSFMKKVLKRDVMTPHNMLRSIGINIRKDMTPKKEKLYSFAKSLSRRLITSTKRKDNFKQRLAAAEKLVKEKNVEEHLVEMNQLAAQFVRCQIREAGKSPKQHRFTIDEKILALSLYKQSPKSYRFLAKIVTLPCKGTLNNLLKEIHFEPGLNENIFESLKTACATWNSSEKIVTLMWDELSLMPNLSFNESGGCIHGFGDMGEKERSNEIADHVLVFMVRGLKKKFKQPVCYAFSSKGGAKAHQIKRKVEQILNKLIDIGLKPLVTVCDQATSNVKVLNTLIKNTKENYARGGREYRGGFFEIQEMKIFPIFDPPHLLKGIRNNFLTKNLSYREDNTQKVAKWEHIVKLYELDNGSNVIQGLRALSHLTDEHIYANKIKKMKVKCATQIFSQRLASSLYLAGNIDTFKTLGEGVHDTSKILLFFDQLFDSVNGNQKFPTQGKTLRCGINSSSDHLRFWKEEAIPFLSTMEFVTQKPGDKAKPPSLKNWIFTLRNIINIWECLKEDGYDYLLGRHLNQDPLENFFGQVRSYGILYTNPTPTTFEQIFKTMLVNSTISLYSPGFNCKADDCKVLFAGIKHFFGCTESVVAPPMVSEATTTMPVIMHPLDLGSQSLQLALSELATNYVAGFLLKKVKLFTRHCDDCKTCLFGDQSSSSNMLINAREYKGGWAKRLFYPSEEFAICFYEIHKTIIRALETDPCSKSLGSILHLKISADVDFTFLKCDSHKDDLRKWFSTLAIRTITHAWCKDVNRLMMGKDTRPYSGKDRMKIIAQKIYLQRKKRQAKGIKIL